MQYDKNRNEGRHGLSVYSEAYASKRDGRIDDRPASKDDGSWRVTLKQRVRRLISPCSPMHSFNPPAPRPIQRGKRRPRRTGGRKSAHSFAGIDSAQCDDHEQWSYATSSQHGSLRLLTEAAANHAGGLTATQITTPFVSAIRYLINT